MPLKVEEFTGSPFWAEYARPLGSSNSTANVAKQFWLESSCKIGLSIKLHVRTAMTFNDVATSGQQ